MKEILIADDHPEVRDILTQRCQRLGLKVHSADNAMTALEIAERCRPDAIILDVNMPNGNGLSVCEMLSGHDQLRSTPVIILTANSSEEVVRRCHQLAAYYVPKHVELWSRIEPLLCEILDLNATASPETTSDMDSPSPASTTTDVLDQMFAILGVESGDQLIADEPSEREVKDDSVWVLSIEDDEDVALALKLRLQDLGVKTVHVSEGMAGYRNAFVNPPNAIILDYELPEGNGDYVLRRLKESPATSSIPVVVLTGRTEGFIERQMNSLGADAFFTKPFHWELLKQKLVTYLEPHAATVS
ncbi:response regulator [Bremerella sp. JC770]|uniref:response regulator n=1 Tax=Bremerella sp. JC770 TaxID=3232137 RepID=UPI003459095F